MYDDSNTLNASLIVNSLVLTNLICKRFTDEQENDMRNRSKNIKINNSQLKPAITKKKSGFKPVIKKNGARVFKALNRKRSTFYIL